jgi:hypothetical protein
LDASADGTAAHGDGASPSDATSDASDGASNGMTTIADPTRWSAFDQAQLDPAGRVYRGGIFAAPFMYFVPDNQGVGCGSFLRYDADLIFDRSSSWVIADSYHFLDGSVFGADCFEGGFFDGHYVTFTGAGKSGRLVRYDTTGSFGDSSAWTTFDTTTLPTPQAGHRGVIFDGRYAYYAPSASASESFLKFDTKMNFDATAFEETPASPMVGYAGGAFDGAYVYFAPHDGAHALMRRYKTGQPFTSASSWEAFDPSMVPGGGRNFFGAAFDGRRVWFIPDGDSPSSILMGYDPTAPFTDPTSWVAFDVSKLPGQPVGCYGAVFDGRRLWLIPRDTPLAVFDTTGRVDDVSAWQTFDVNSVDPIKAPGRFTGGFDGKNVYLSPLVGQFLQFHAWDTPVRTPVGGAFF